MNREMKYRAYTLHNYKKIPQIKNLSPKDIEAIEVVGRVLPFRSNSYVVEQLINWDNIPNDPIFTLTFPRKEMLSEKHYNQVLNMLGDNEKSEKYKKTIDAIRRELNPNPAGQAHNIPTLEGEKLNGMQHKYRETVLFFPSQGQTCHAYCTFCFRWPQFSGMSDLKFAMKEANLLHKYLLEHKEVKDVLFTGGDPLTASAKILATYIEPLLTKEFAHIRNIRIGSKTLSYWPYRFITDKDADLLINLFAKVRRAGKNLAFQAHFNHPIELSTNAVKEAISRIKDTGAQIRTQSPLLDKINNSPEIWSKMWQKQVDLGCIPYYMFIARDTGSKAFFEVPLVDAWELFRKAYASVSGICRTVRGPSMSAYPGKVVVRGVREIKGEKIFILNFLQSRNPKLVGIPFFAKYDSKATWLDQLKPAFGESKFFYEKDDILGENYDNSDLWK